MPRRSRSDRPAGADGPRVLVATRGGPLGLSVATMRRRAEKMLAFLDLRRVELSLVLVDDATMRALNRSHRRIDKPTDVLAFPMEEQPLGDDGLLGDVVISVPTAARQAARRKRPLLAEATMLLAHGLLHLLGYDHRTASEEREMKRRTRELTATAERRAVTRSRLVSCLTRHDT